MTLQRIAGAAALGFILAGAGAVAQAACPAGLPPGVYCGEHSAREALAGTYALDPAHAAVIAKVSHIGYSLSVFRFDKMKGELAWQPAALDKTRLSVTVETASIATNVPGFAADIGDKFIKAKEFPQAAFVSTAFRQTGPTHAQVDGQFTLMGKTRPVTFDVELIGAGKGFGKPRMGVEATTRINPADYGLPDMLGETIEIVVDAEFAKTD